MPTTPRSVLSTSLFPMATSFASTKHRQFAHWQRIEHGCVANILNSGQQGEMTAGIKGTGIGPHTITELQFVRRHIGKRRQRTVMHIRPREGDIAQTRGKKFPAVVRILRDLVTAQIGGRQFGG